MFEEQRTLKMAEEQDSVMIGHCRLLCNKEAPKLGYDLARNLQMVY